MRDDLLDAMAGVDWANAQLPILESRIKAWRETSPYELVEEFHPYNGEKVYKFANIRRLPSVVNVEAGLVIHALRSSLDVLANTLAQRNGSADPKNTQFPICRDEARFRWGKHAGLKEIKLLSAADCSVIENLKPWAGGYPHLFDLHTLDIVRKHRRLIGVYVMPVRATVSSLDGERGWRFSAVWKGFEDDAIVGWAKIDAPKPDFDVSLEVTLSEGRPYPAVPVLSVLDQFTRTTAEIINLFDNP